MSKKRYPRYTRIGDRGGRDHAPLEVKRAEECGDVDTGKRLRDSESFEALWPFSFLPPLEEIRQCIHCYRKFRFGDAKVIANPHFRNAQNPEGLYISCPYWPRCDGTAVDFFEVRPSEERPRRKRSK